MSRLISKKPSFTNTANFWDDNPQLIYMSPFHELYKRDKTKDKNKSSKEMWMIFWMSDPDDEINPYYRMPDKERLDMLKKNFYSGFNEDDLLVQQCIEQYPIICLDTIERNYKEHLDFLTRRSNFIRQQEYNLENMAELDRAAAASSKIWADFEKATKEFIENKDKKINIRGGRTQSKSERGEI